MPHKLNHARRHKFEKAKYRVSNWRGIVRANSITFPKRQNRI